jgi:hypothetical protein
MPDEKILREKARAAIVAGKLPTRRPDSTWGGRGANIPCAVCDVPVKTEELEFEIEFAPEGDHLERDKFHFHIRCFAAWEFERTKDLL